ncbi:MAG: GNAT family N-acetyltransferase [Lachnospiraceae bacterium]|nr:GNAT family N-acetyltransferase [Lachnospiraceae bacterium]
MVKYRTVKTDADWRNISKLYKKAFPLSERKPLCLIRSTHKKNKADVWLIEDEGTFKGFAITMNSGDLVMLDYFAVAEDARGKGYGSSCLKWLQAQYKGYRFFLEIESIYIKAKNMEQRIGRKSFYERNGMREVGIVAKVFGVELVSMGYDCALTFEEYKKLYTDCYGKLVGMNIREVKRG